MSISIKLKLLTWKIVKGEHPIAISIINHRKRTIIYTGYLSKLEHWDLKNNCPNKKNPLFKELNVALNLKKLEVQKLVIETDINGKLGTSEAVKNSVLKKRKYNSASVFTFFDEVCEKLNSSGRIKYSSIFMDTKRNLMNFRNKRDFQFSDLTPGFLSKYEEWNLNRGLAPNSLFVYLRTIRTLFNRAISEEICSENSYPFKKFSLKKYSGIKTRKRALTKAEMNGIIAYPTTTDHNHFNTKNYFVFSYYAWGMNFGDLASLQWADFDGTSIKYSRKKTGDMFNIKLLQPAIDIILQYKKSGNYNENDYIFPILDSKVHISPNQINNRLTKIIKRTNKELKEIATEVGLKPDLTTYVSRHTFATVLKKEGAHTAMISEMMGHESEQITNTYLDDFESSTLFEASKALLG